MIPFLNVSTTVLCDILLTDTQTDKVNFVKSLSPFVFLLLFSLFSSFFLFFPFSFFFILFFFFFLFSQQGGKKGGKVVKNRKKIKKGEKSEGKRKKEMICELKQSGYFSSIKAEAGPDGLNETVQTWTGVAALRSRIQTEENWSDGTKEKTRIDQTKDPKTITN